MMKKKRGGENTDYDKEEMTDYDKEGMTDYDKEGMTDYKTSSSPETEMNETTLPEEEFTAALGGSRRRTRRSARISWTILLAVSPWSP